ncbi:transcriptional regulator [Enemella evansiae]|uniref:sugar-binding transcriptional regulator n=1 Tax=Enemella evansiae TaxID=2016499 RepID=UPI000B96EF21|nr:sugar-binding domain-containing protein [Enemella evansiae]OYO10805.1 transcriptional regulator [Enemella evansiae]
MDGRDEEAYRAAELYYLQNETMESIATQLGVSRSTVSRLLSTARAEGWVRITLGPRPGGDSELAARLRRTLRVRAHLVPTRASATDEQRLDQVTTAAARLTESLVRPSSTLGMAWGSTVAAVASRLRRTPTPGVSIVQLNGSANTTTSGIPYSESILSTAAEAFDAQVHWFPVPAFFDYAETKRALWRERSIAGVLSRQAECDLALFGVGSLAGPRPSHVYTSGYLDQDTMTELSAGGVVGDVCTVLLRADGSYADLDINDRASGPTPAQLQTIGRRVCVVSGRHKVRATLAVLRARVATDLVIDESTARELLRAAAPSKNGRVR